MRRNWTLGSSPVLLLRRTFKALAWIGPAAILALAPQVHGAEPPPQTAPIQDGGAVPMGEALDFLEVKCRDLLAGCRIPASDGTILYTPDGKGNYRALWTRDFAYMVIYAGDLMPPDNVEAAIRYLIRGQREDGAVPDRVRPDGVPIYVAGPDENPLGEPNLDNPPFLVLAADAHWNRVDEDRRRALFLEWSTNLDRGLAYVPRSASGLVWNDPDHIHSPYGFTDTVGKTGDLFMESMLYWQAARCLARWHRHFGNGKQASEYTQQAGRIASAVGGLWDEDSGAFLAASRDCRQIDIWGNAYAVAIEFPMGSRRERVIDFLVKNYERYVWCGQVRHLLEGEYWHRLLTPVPRDRYQNGAYWATASGWVMQALAYRDRSLAARMFADLVEDFQNHDICECIHHNYRQLPSYVVSATNPRSAAKSLFQAHPAK